MITLDGKAVAAARSEKLKARVQSFQSQAQRPPHLVVVLVGNDPASQVYVRNKGKACENVGIKSTQQVLPAEISQSELEKRIQELNQDSSVDGILVQMPLPKGLDERKLLEIISPMKDVDGFTFGAMGRLWAGEALVAPCTPKGVMSLLEHYQIPVAGQRAVVVGRSNVVGRPMAELLTQANATVTLCHSKTPDIRTYTKEADLVVVAAGRKHLLGKEDFKKGAVVVDVGIHGSGGDGKLAGDVRFSELDGWVKAATPVPGGVGPMTIATLLENLMALAEKSRAPKNQDRS